MRLLVDTNVLIDYLGRKAPFYEAAERVIAAGYFGDVQLWIPVQSFKDAFYVLSHYIESSRVQSAMEKLLEIAHPVDLTGSDVATALRLRWPDFEDCLIALCAQKVAADYLVTRDRKGFAGSMVPAIAPVDWLAHMEAKGLMYGAIDWQASSGNA